MDGVEGASRKHLFLLHFRKHDFSGAVIKIRKRTNKIGTKGLDHVSSLLVVSDKEIRDGTSVDPVHLFWSVPSQSGRYE